MTVAAAADLAPLESLLSSSYAQKHPRVLVKYVTESSAALAQQIENGAPYDVFLSANVQFVDRLVHSKHLRLDSVRAYAEGRLGVLWRDGKPHELKDLNDKSVRFVALPNPQLAPYGVAAQESLEKARLWAQVQPKVVYGENVRQALQLFTSGNADAVITAASLLVGKSPQLLPTASHAPILQKAGVVSTTQNLESADGFLNFLTSPSGQAVFARFGFTSPRLADER